MNLFESLNNPETFGVMKDFFAYSVDYKGKEAFKKFFSFSITITNDAADFVSHRDLYKQFEEVDAKKTSYSKSEVIKHLAASGLVVTSIGQKDCQVKGIRGIRFLHGPEAKVNTSNTRLNSTRHCLNEDTWKKFLSHSQNYRAKEILTPDTSNTRLDSTLPCLDAGVQNEDTRKKFLSHSQNYRAKETLTPDTSNNRLDSTLPCLDAGVQNEDTWRKFLSHSQNYRAKKAFISFCEENIMFTGLCHHFVFQNDLTSEFSKYYGKTVSAVPLGMHLATAGVRKIRLGKKQNKKYGFIGICFGDRRGRMHAPRAQRAGITGDDQQQSQWKDNKHQPNSLPSFQEPVAAEASPAPEEQQDSLTEILQILQYLNQQHYEEPSGNTSFH